MKTKKLDILCDITTRAHTRIQKDFKEINPLVGVNQRMREMGVPVDALTIDCLKSGKRIILLLHDQQPDRLSYQFTFKDQDPADKFEQILFDELSETQLYDWIKDYFQSSAATS